MPIEVFDNDREAIEFASTTVDYEIIELIDYVVDMQQRACRICDKNIHYLEVIKKHYSGDLDIQESIAKSINKYYGI